MIDKKAIELLKKIDEKGMIILHSYQIPIPMYAHTYHDSGELVPKADWDTYLSLWEKRYTKPTFVKGMMEVDIVIKSTDNTIRHTREWQCRPGEICLISTIVDELLFNDTSIGTAKNPIPDEQIVLKNMVDMCLNEVPEKVVAIAISTNNNAIFVPAKEYSVSEYINTEKIDMSDEFEEFFGLLERIKLTEKAQQLIGK